MAGLRSVFKYFRRRGNVRDSVAFFMGAEEALRSVLRALLIFRRLHFHGVTASLQLQYVATPAEANLGPACISTGTCDSVPRLA